MNLQFLGQYQLEIIIGLTLVLLIVLLSLFIKKRQKKKEAPLEIQPVVADEYAEDIQETQRDVDDTNREQDTEQTTEKEVEVATDSEIATDTEAQEPSFNFKKRPVPPHEKIKKEDFNQFSGMRILLAEDNLINQKVILGLLKDSGIEVIVANDGQEALDILENDTDFALILMDAHMPNVDGFEATRIIRKNPQYNHIAVIALSGDTASDDIKKMKDAGMSDTLEKPLKMDDFYDILYAYNAEKTDKPKQKTTTTKIDDNKLLNTTVGLDICGGDISFYKDILQEFLQDYSNSDASLLQLIKENRLEEADQLLLDITGICANLGAQELHDTALEAKTTLKTSTTDLSKIVASYRDNLQQTTILINKYIQEN